MREDELGEGAEALRNQARLVVANLERRCQTLRRIAQECGEIGMTAEALEIHRVVDGREEELALRAAAFDLKG